MSVSLSSPSRARPVESTFRLSPSEPIVRIARNHGRRTGLIMPLSAIAHRTAALSPSDPMPPASLAASASVSAPESLRIACSKPRRLSPSDPTPLRAVNQYSRRSDLR